DDVEGAGRRARDDPLHEFARRRAAAAQDRRSALQTLRPENRQACKFLRRSSRALKGGENANEAPVTDWLSVRVGRLAFGACIRAGGRRPLQTLLCDVP